MVRSTPLRVLALLVLCAVLAAPGMSAAAPRPGGEPAAARLSVQGTGDLFGWLRSTVASLWNKAGCRADPHGICLDSTTAPVKAENGCELDPNGRCRN